MWHMLGTCVTGAILEAISAQTCVIVLRQNIAPMSCPKHVDFSLGC